MTSSRPAARSERARAFRWIAVGVLASIFLCVGVPSSAARASYKSDQNRDGLVNLQDLILFSENVLRQDWRTVDWCAWIEQPHKQQEQFADLILFIRDYFDCDFDLLAVSNSNASPTRVAWGPNGRLYVSDAKVGSVFIYERLPQLTPVAELKYLSTPLGVLVDAQGSLFVGNDGRGNVEVYSSEGLKTATIGEGTIQMPNDLALDAAGRLYVADSRSNKVWVFDLATGGLVRSIGDGELRFPAAVAVAGGEVFVADQSNFGVKVFDLQGALLRTLGGPVRQGSLGFKWKGLFIRLQDLEIDGSGRVHTLDSHMNLIQILDPVGGGYLGSYGTQGAAPGELNLPLGMALNASGEMAVANRANQRVDVITTP
jgi:DNA-binding beta-propeller fold protein YncE